MSHRSPACCVLRCWSARSRRRCALRADRRYATPEAAAEAFIDALRRQRPPRRCARCSAPTGSASSPPRASSRTTSTPSSPPGTSSTRSVPKARQGAACGRRRRLDAAGPDRQGQGWLAASTRGRGRRDAHAAHRPQRARRHAGGRSRTTTRRRSTPRRTATATACSSTRRSSSAPRASTTACTGRRPRPRREPARPAVRAAEAGRGLLRLPLQDPQGQGKDAPGGAYDYVIGKRMRSGFALHRLAGALRRHRRDELHGQPRRHRLREGPRPEHRAVASAMTTFDPDASWQKISVP